MNVVDIVCGLAWGDEAKGKITSQMSKEEMNDYARDQQKKQRLAAAGVTSRTTPPAARTNRARTLPPGQGRRGSRFCRPSGSPCAGGELVAPSPYRACPPR